MERKRTRIPGFLLLAGVLLAPAAVRAQDGPTAAETICDTFERDTTTASRHRARSVDTDERAVFEISCREPKPCAK